MKIVKRTLIAIAVVALLASATQAQPTIDICTMDILIDVGYDGVGVVKGCYFDCEEIRVSANSDTELSLRIDAIYPELIHWDFHFEAGEGQHPTIIPGDWWWHRRKVCVETRISGPLSVPGGELLVGWATLTATPFMGVGNSYWAKTENCGEYEIKLEQVVCGFIWVDIDIKPGSDPNPINAGSNGLVPVAILSSEDFDATTVDETLVSLAGATVAVLGKSNSLAHEEDVNGDGLVDLVVQVKTQGFDDLGTGGTVELTGKTFSGEDIVGYDEVVIVPANQ